MFIHQEAFSFIADVLNLGANPRDCDLFFSCLDYNLCPRGLNSQMLTPRYSGNVLPELCSTMPNCKASWWLKWLRPAFPKLVTSGCCQIPILIIPGHDQWSELKGAVIQSHLEGTRLGKAGSDKSSKLYPFSKTQQPGWCWAVSVGLWLLEPLSSIRSAQR